MYVVWDSRVSFSGKEAKKKKAIYTTPAQWAHQNGAGLISCPCILFVCSLWNRERFLRNFVLMAGVLLHYSYLVSFLAHLFVVIRRVWPPGLNNNDTRVLPPSPPSLPIIGNLHQLVRGYRHRTLEALAKRHGPLFLLRLGSVPTIVVSSATMAEEVLKTQDQVFCSRPQQYTARGILYDCRDVGFCPYGDRWRKLRRIAVDHLLSTPRVDSFRGIREEEVASLMDRIRVASARDSKRQGVNVTEQLVSLTNSVVSRAAFGNKLGGMEPRVVHELFKEVFDLLQTIAVSDVFPRLGWMDWAAGLDSRTKRIARKLDHLLETALQEHEKSGLNNGDDGDLLDDLLVSILKEEDNNSGLKLDRTDAKGLIAVSPDRHFLS